MRKILILLAIMVLSVAATAYAGKLDSPHLAAGLICGDCHQYGNFPDDIACTSCHTNTSGGGYSKANGGPFEKTHSSANTSTKYGTWSLLCKHCHMPHTQDQIDAYGSATYLATTKITSITTPTANTVVYGYDTLNIIRPEWSDTTKWSQKSGNERGLIFFDTNNPSRLSHEIINVDTVAKTITVTGTLTNGGATTPPSVGDTFAVLYGQYIRSLLPSEDNAPVSPPFPSTVTLNNTVRFFTNSGPNSFAYDESGTGTDPVVDGVCQVCHTKTNHWRNDGTRADHNSGLTCTKCHAHPQGFKASCDACHGFPPPPLAGQNGSTPTGSTTAGAHVKHVNTLGFDCAKCHFNSVGTGPTHMDNIISLGFVDLLGPSTFTGGSYDGQTTANYESTDPGTTVSKSGSKTCTNIYCHSNAQGNGGTSSRTYSSPVWDNPASVQCGTCHKADGVQGNASLMDSGSHTKHVSAPYFKPCSECHNGFGPGTPQHVDFNIDLAFPKDLYGNTGSYSQSPNPPGNGYGSCSNVYCHSIVQNNGGTPLVAGSLGYTTPTWGSGALNCASCHEAPPASGAHTIHATDGGTGYKFPCDTCHFGSVPPASTTHVNKIIDVNINPAKGAGATYSLGSHAPGIGYGNCSNTYCHSNGTSVATGTIPANASPVWSGSTTCGSCHGGGNPTGQPNYPNGSPKANSHPQHPTDCSLCHSATTTTGTTITNLQNHDNGVYNLQAKSPSVSFTYSFASTGGTCSSISCHSGNNATWGGTVACGGCHAIPPATGAHATHIQDASLITKAYGNTEVKSNQNSYAFGCGNCHPVDPAFHGNGTVDISLNPADGGTLKSKNDPAANRIGTGGSTVCNEIYCHSNGASGKASNLATAASPQWGGTFSGDRCAGCHGNSPSGTPAHGAHVVGIHYNNIYTNTSGLATAGSTGTSSHGLSSTSTTINCNICHNNTVTATGNDLNTVCATCHDGTKAKLEGTAAIANKIYHVNGMPDIAFASITMQSKAQLRDDITKVTELNTTWSRQNGYKADGSHDQANSFTPSYDASARTCSSVACHNGHQVNWDSQNITCFSCHTDLPK